jgi:MFS transporter, OFA family, oxalate/formate antiporter
MSHAVRHKGWSVTFAGTGINLALGVLYTWSIFKESIAESIRAGGVGAFNWDLARLNDPYAVACLVFAFAMILAGRCQDRFGPRITAMLGGILVGLGFIWISQTTSYAAWVLGFGVLAGTGIGFGYSAATPPALKWFPAAKTGLIAGLVVSGFGLASLYIAPLSQYLLGTVGLQRSMMIFGVAFLLVVGALSMLLVNPPKGYVPAASSPRISPLGKGSEPPPGPGPEAKEGMDMEPREILRTGGFWKLWLIFFIGAGAGLMVIGSVAGMAQSSLGEAAFWAVAIMAVGNAAGRIVAGMVSDRIGRKNTLAAMLLFQAVLMAVAIPVVGSESTGPFALLLLATFIGFNYGTNLSLFPSFTKDLWGLKNFGMNYGLLFTSWGVGGFVLSRLSQMLMASTGAYSASLLISALLLVVGAGITLTLSTKPKAAPIPLGTVFHTELGATMADGGERVGGR